MPRNEEGEYELLLGNRQLLSIFVIIVVLFGIFFAMGYITGKNSGGAAIAASKPPAAAPVSSAPADQPAPDQTPKASAAGGAVIPPPSANPAPTQSEPATAPAPTTASTEKPSAPASAAATPPGSDVAEPAPGETFLQITAVARHDAELMSDTLNKRGFSARIAPSHTGLFRVLVGPVHDAASLARLRSSLEDAGFRNTIVRKY